MTAHALAGEREKTEAAGMDDFLTKPLTGQRLEEILAKWVALGTGAAPTPRPFVEACETCTPKIVALFETRVRADLEEIARAVGDRDAVKLGDLAHRLKGGCSVVGAVRMELLSSEIEVTAKRGSSEVASLVAELKSAYGPTLEELRKAATSSHSRAATGLDS